MIQGITKIIDPALKNISQRPTIANTVLYLINKNVKKLFIGIILFSSLHKSNVNINLQTNRIQEFQGAHAVCYVTGLLWS